MPSQVEADADKRDHPGPRSAAGAVADSLSHAAHVEGKRDHLVPRPAAGAVADSSARVAHAESGRG